ncbi:MAG: Uncharacterized protein XD76_0464 [candidate division TA06 bacterium 32_111]|uniref:DUF2089 domain-containing protein n=2 Tax=Bacteria candidate phyla TaxID=1783234 RepID=A0A124G0F6_UNCT6|nr:MAG: Uncharacterized protein XD76_0464 [candidate division TA06 bacterium 32_111]KUK87356.1 MAG: Uncharacterized protein XE03_0754 [candidate division TA06 bacterium 34_109]HAF07811.1 hypothetical protein [candidate division WOR-3 bacterium]HCP17329.1 hypothetical protein [candidate division WOR-3 bacterium]
MFNLVKKGFKIMKEIIKKCPVCGGSLTVRKLVCESCDTEINGKFGVERSSILDDEDWNFVKEFIFCEGNFKLLSERLGLSYPTLKIKLSKIKEKLNMGKDNINSYDDEIDSYLSMLEKGEIGVNDVIKILKRSKK